MYRMSEAEWNALDHEDRFVVWGQAYMWPSATATEPVAVEIVTDEPGPTWDTSLEGPA